MGLGLGRLLPGRRLGLVAGQQRLGLRSLLMGQGIGGWRAGVASAGRRGRAALAGPAGFVAGKRAGPDPRPARGPAPDAKWGPSAGLVVGFVLPLMRLGHV